MVVELDEPKVVFLRASLEEKEARLRDHLEWLSSEAAVEEEDKDRQRAECDNAVVQVKAILALLGEPLV